MKPVRGLASCIPVDLAGAVRLRWLGTEAQPFMSLISRIYAFARLYTTSKFSRESAAAAQMSRKERAKGWRRELV